MKKLVLQKFLSVFLSLIIFTMTYIPYIGTVASAASSFTLTAMQFPRQNDTSLSNAQKNNFGAGNLKYLNGYKHDARDRFYLYKNKSTNDITYCIEPGVFTANDTAYTNSISSDAWVKIAVKAYKNAGANKLTEDELKGIIGRIMYFGYTGSDIGGSTYLNTATNRQNVAETIATQVLLWESIVGERNADFRKLSNSKIRDLGYDPVLSCISNMSKVPISGTKGPDGDAKYTDMKALVMAYYKYIETKVQTRNILPSFTSPKEAKATVKAMKYDAKNGAYSLTLTDSSGVSDNFTYSCSDKNVKITKSGNKIVITSSKPVSEAVIKASKSVKTKGYLCWYSDSRQNQIVPFSSSESINGYLKVTANRAGARVIKVIPADRAEADAKDFLIVLYKYNSSEKKYEIYKSAKTVSGGRMTTTINSFSKYDSKLSPYGEIYFDDIPINGTYRIAEYAKNGSAALSMYYTAASNPAAGIETQITVSGDKYTLLKETLSSKSSETAPKISLEEGKTTTVYFKNEYSEVPLTITKTDSSGNSVPDIGIEVSYIDYMTGKTFTSIDVTNSNGSLNMMVKPGYNYVVTELLTSDQFNKFAAVKDTSKGSVSLAGKTYYYTTKTSGIYIRSTKDGEFSVSATSVLPATATAAKAIFVNKYQTGNVSIKKTMASDTTGSVSGWYFLLKSPDGSESVVGPTDSNGDILITGKCPGSYTITELLTSSQHGQGWNGDTNTTYKSGSSTYYKTTKTVTKNVLTGSTTAFSFENTKTKNTAVKVIKKLTVVHQKPQEEVPEGVKVLRTDDILGTKFVTYMETIPVKLYDGGQVGVSDEAGGYVVAPGILAQQGIWFKLQATDNWSLFTTYPELKALEDSGDIIINKTATAVNNSLIDMKTTRTVSYSSSKVQYVYLIHKDENGNPVSVDGATYYKHKIASGESYKVYTNIRLVSLNTGELIENAFVSPEFVDFYLVQGRGSDSWRSRLAIKGIIGKTDEKGEVVFSNLPVATGKGYELFELNASNKLYTYTQLSSDFNTVIKSANLSELTDPHVTRISDISYIVNGRKEYLSEYEIASGKYGTYSSYHLSSGDQYVMSKIVGIPTKTTDVGADTTAAKMNTGTLPSSMSASKYKAYNFYISDSTTQVVYNNDEKWTELPVTKSMVDGDGNTTYPEGVVLQLAVDDPLTGITEIRYAITDVNGVATFRYVPASSTGSYSYRITEISSPLTTRLVRSDPELTDDDRFATALQTELMGNAYTKITEQNGKVIPASIFLDTVNKIAASEEPIDINDPWSLFAMLFVSLAFNMYMGIGNYTASVSAKWTGQFDTLEMSKFYQGDTTYDKAATDKSTAFVSNLSFNKTTHVINEERVGRLVVKKSTDAVNKSEVQGITFRLKGTSIYGKEVDITATTNEYGYAVFENVPISSVRIFDSPGSENVDIKNILGTSYNLTEVSQNSKYLPVSGQDIEIFWDRETDTIDFSNPDTITYGAEFINTTKKFNVELTKTVAGNDTAGHSLEGAVYGLYRSIPSEEDELLETFITDADGKATSSEYYEYGNGSIQYYILELEAPEGYTLDTSKHYITTDVSTVTKEFTTEKVTSTENLMKGYIKIHKMYEKNQQRDIVNEPGAEFDIYPVRFLSYSEAPGEYRDHLVTDSSGNASTKALPVGEYIVHQTKGTTGTAFAEDFSIIIADDKPLLSVEAYEIVNKALSAKLKIEKRDSVSGETVITAGAGFSIFSPDSEEPIEMTVFEEQPDLVIYNRVIRGKASHPVISEEPDPEDSNLTIKNFLRVGLFSSSESLFTEENAIDVSVCGEDGNFSFENVSSGNYKMVPIDSGSDQQLTVVVTSSGGEVSGISDEITALVVNEETYVDRDPIEKKETVFYTDETGTVILPETLVCANGYKLVEVEAPEGYELDKEPVIFNIGSDIEETDDFGTPILTVIKEDRPISGSLKVLKTDSKYPDKKLSGAEFTVYTDIDANGIYDMGDTVYGIMNETPQGVYSLTNIPQGSYLVRETKAPEHFVKDSGFYPVTITESKEYFVSNDTENNIFTNEAEEIVLRIKKTSWDGVVKGLRFLIECKELGYRETFVTGEDGTIAVSLREGTYTISEVHNAESRGYVIPNPVTVTLSYDTGDQTVEMYNGKQVDTDGISSVGMLVGIIGLASFIATAFISIFAFIRHRRSANI